MLRRSALILLLTACSTELVLPDPPSPVTVEAPTIASFGPDRGFAGTHVRVQGTGLIAAGRSLSVRFGSSAPVDAVGTATEIEAVVPEDATTGPIEVVVGGNVATSAGSFEMLGTGRLRNGRVAAERTMLPAIEGAIPLGEGKWLFHARDLVAASIIDLRPSASGVETATPLPLANVTAIAAGGDTVVVVSNDEPDCGNDCSFDQIGIYVFDREALAAGVTTPRRAIVLEEYDSALGSMIAGLLFSSPTITVSNDGAFALLHEVEDAIVVPLSSTSPSQRMNIGLGDGAPVATQLPAGGEGFVLKAGSKVWLLDPTTTPPKKTAVTFAPSLDEMERVVAAQFPLVAVLQGGRRIAIRTMDGSADERVTTLQLPEGGTAADFATRVDGAAFSKDGESLVVAQRTRGLVTIWRLGEQPEQLASVDMDRPHSVVVDGARVWVAHRGGMTGVSPTTGQLLERVSVPFGPRVPRFGPFDCGGAPREGIELFSSTFSRFARLDPRSLAPIERGDCPAPPGEHRYRGLVDRVELDDGTQVFLTDSSLFAVPAGQSDITVIGAVPGGVSLHRAAGRPLVVAVGRNSFRVFDLSTIAPSTGTRVLVDDLEGGEFVGSDVFAAVTSTGIEFHGVGDGAPELLIETGLIGSVIVGSGRRGLLDALGSGPTVNQLQRVLPRDGTSDLVEQAPDVEWSAWMWEAPGSRMLWVLGASTLTERWFDPATGLVGRVTHSFRHPFFDASIASSRDGERLLLVEQYGDDRLWLLD